MLHVSVHSGALTAASRFNTLAWLDIGYERLEPIADYKVVLFQSGIGATLPVTLPNYPRWSASLWDLTARALALCLSAASGEASEAIQPVPCTRKRFAFASRISAEIAHTPSGSGRHRRTLGTVEIAQAKQRGVYVARFDEHTQPRHTTAPFRFAADYLHPAELLLHACAVRLTGQAELPPRPALCVPPPVEINGVRFVPLHLLVEPARTGFAQWLARNSEPPLEHEKAPLGIAPETLYAQFLRDAV